MGLAEVYEDKGLYKEAIEEYRKVVDADAKNTGALYNLALVYEKVDPKEAVNLWERYIGLAGSQPSEKDWVDVARLHLKKLKQTGELEPEQALERGLVEAAHHLIADHDHRDRHLPGELDQLVARVGIRQHVDILERHPLRRKILFRRLAGPSGGTAEDPDLYGCVNHWLFLPFVCGGERRDRKILPQVAMQSKGIGDQSMPASPRRAGNSTACRCTPVSTPRPAHLIAQAGEIWRLGRAPVPWPRRRFPST